jgi:hypothetical protein
MWLDRLSGHSTPAATPSGSPPPPANRSYSPAPRRSSNLAPASAAQRPGFNPRSSSLSLVSNESTASLLASSRKPNGSALKQAATVVDTPDPLEALERIIGPEATPDGQAKRSDVAADEFELELDFDGLTLREVADTKLFGSEGGNVYTAQSIEECMFCETNFCCILPCANQLLQLKGKRKNLRTFTGQFVPATMSYIRLKSI